MEKDKNYLAVFIGENHEERFYDGAVIGGIYYDKNELSKNKLLKKFHRQIEKLVTERNYCFEDAPLRQDKEDGLLVFYYDFPFPKNWR